MKLIKPLGAIAMTLATSTAAFAGEGSGKITTTAVLESGVAIFGTTVHSGKPACQQNTGDDWAIDTKTPSGKAIYAAVLTAMSQNLTIMVRGTSSCNVWYDRETAAQFYTYPSPQS